MCANIRRILLGLQAMSALQWMSVFQGCPQGGVVLELKYHEVFLFLFSVYFVLLTATCASCATTQKCIEKNAANLFLLSYGFHFVLLQT